MTDTSTSDPKQLEDILIDGFTNAAGLLARQLNDTSEWEVIALFPQTLLALRGMPVDLQNTVGEDLVGRMIGTLGGAVDTERGRALLSKFDIHIAATLHDAGQFIMSEARSLAERRKKIARGSVIL